MFWEATKAQVTINSYSLSTSISIGSIIRQQANLLTCMNRPGFESLAQVQRTAAIYSAAMSADCFSALSDSQQSVQILNASFQFTYLTGANLQYVYTSNSPQTTLRVTKNGSLGYQLQFTFTNASFD